MGVFCLTAVNILYKSDMNGRVDLGQLLSP